MFLDNEDINRIANICIHLGIPFSEEDRITSTLLDVLEALTEKIELMAHIVYREEE